MCVGPPALCSTNARQPTAAEEQELDAVITKALSCPCVDDLKAGPCGQLFVTAFTCYHRSRSVPKGCDCLEANLAFAECLRQHPEVLEDLAAARSDAPRGSGSSG